jgi:creatinine amidohydrolase
MIIRDYSDSLVHCGFKQIIFLPYHGGNFATVEIGIKESQKNHPEVKISGYTNLLGFSQFANSVSKEFGISDDESGAHAGEHETSIMLFLEKNLVNKEKFEPGYIGPAGEKEVSIIIEKGMPALTKNGILGDPRKASADRGDIYLDRLADFFVEEIAKQ